MSNSNGKRREPTWEELAKYAGIWGWFGQHIGKDKIIFERGRQRIEAKKVPSTNKWKVEYYSGKIMDDTTGLEAEFLAKRDAVEMCIGK